MQAPSWKDTASPLQRQNSGQSSSNGANFYMNNSPSPYPLRTVSAPGLCFMSIWFNFSGRFSTLKKLCFSCDSIFLSNFEYPKLKNININVCFNLNFNWNHSDVGFFNLALIPLRIDIFVFVFFTRDKIG